MTCPEQAYRTGAAGWEAGTIIELRSLLLSRNQWWTDRRRHGPAMLVNGTFANDEAVNGRAVTLYSPPTQLAVQVTLAMPFESVMANGGEREHDAPLAGVVKSTRTPGAGRPAPSNTLARIIDPLAVAVIVAFGGASTAPNRIARILRLPAS